jgi:hypothetical protein
MFNGLHKLKLMLNKDKYHSIRASTDNVTLDDPEHHTLIVAILVAQQLIQIQFH